MGSIFKLEHANIMAYMTSNFYAPPRVLRQNLEEFLDVLSSEAKPFFLNPEIHPVVRTPEQIARKFSLISDIARKASYRLSETRGIHESVVVPPPVLGRLLDDLRTEFADYALYVLAVGTGERLQKAAQELASSSIMFGQLIVFIAQNGEAKRNFEVLDPVPVFSTALHAAPDWPGFLFWTQTGTSTFARLDEVKELIGMLSSEMEWLETRWRQFPLFLKPVGLDHVLRDWTKQTQRGYRRLLHLSDLHFGTSDATENQALLDAELREIVQSVDRVVITGDLFDTPNKNYASLFSNFKNNITLLAKGREPISITGNHDQRMIGLFGADYKQVALIGSRKIVVDDQCEMIFICFNSSEGGRFARGRITKSQFRQLGGDYRTLTASRPELKSYLPIVLVHHHPFSFDVPPETLVQRALSAIGLRDESFLEMVDAEDLHRWCLDWHIKTILHGHKHQARYIEREITNGSNQMLLTAIGCGSSLGAEGSPVSYNMLEWDRTSQRWIASFFESVNGGAFRETVGAVSLHQ